MRILGSLTDPIKPIMILTIILMVLGETWGLEETGKAEIRKEERIFPFLFTAQLSLDIFLKT